MVVICFAIWGNYHLMSSTVGCHLDFGSFGLSYGFSILYCYNLVMYIYRLSFVLLSGVVIFKATQLIFSSLIENLIHTFSYCPWPKGGE
jgi:hypothetical protein